VSANAGKSTDSDEDADMMDEAESSADEALPVIRRRIRRADDVLSDDNMEVCLPVCVCVCCVMLQRFAQYEESSSGRPYI